VSERPTFFVESFDKPKAYHGLLVALTSEAKGGGDFAAANVSFFVPPAESWPYRRTMENILRKGALQKAAAALWKNRKVIAVTAFCSMPARRQHS